MPDRAIIDLTEASELTDSDLAVIYQDGETKQITAETMKEYMGGGIGDITALPAASTIASNDLAVISQGGTAKKVTAEQLKNFVKSGERGETVTLTVDRTGTLYSIPYSIVEPGDTHTRNCYKLTDTVLTDAELLSVVYMDVESNLYPLVEMTQTEFLSGSAYTDPGTWYAITGGSVKLATYTSGQGTTNQYSSAAMRCNSTLLIVVPESGSGYTAGTYATEQFSRSAPSLTYTVGGSSSGGEPGQGILAAIVNLATGSPPATVTGLSRGSLYKTGDMFLVASEKACVVGVSFDGEQYMELWAAETDKPNTYAFRLPTLTGSFYVGVALRGNAQGTGQVRPEDATRITRYIANREVPGTYDTDCELPGIQLLAADADSSGYVTAHDSERILRYLAGPTYTTDNTLDWKVWPSGGVLFAAGVTF